MAFVIGDRVRETSTTTGTGNFTLAGAVTGYRTFDTVLDTSDTTYYTIADQSGANFEVGIGTFTSPATLARTTILSSSNGGSAVTFTSGTKDVFISLPASKTVQSFSAGSTGLTPSTASFGAVALAGTLVPANGGTGTSTAFTAGSVVFAGASGVYAQDNASLFFDDTNNRLGIGTSSPSQKLEVYAAANSLQIESVVRNDQAGSGVAAIGFNVSSSAAAETTSTKAGIGLVRSNAYGVGSLCFYNNATSSAGNFTTADEKMRIDTSGNVGIGTSSPAYKLDINSITGWAANNTAPIANIVGANAPTNGGGNLRVLSNTSATADAGGSLVLGGYYTAQTNSVDFAEISGRKQTGQTTGGYLALSTRADLGNETERLRIDSSGNVGIGTSSPSTYGKFVVAGGDGNTQFNVGTNGVLRIAGYNSFWGGALLESVNTAQSAYLPIVVNGLHTVLATGGTERARIDSSGDFSVGTTVSAGRITCSWVSATQQGIVTRSTSETYNGSPVLFQNSTGGTSGFIGQATSSVTYNTSSDYRMKENVAPLNSGLATIAALKPISYDWIIDKSKGEGFIAHELAEHIPLAVTGEKDATNEDGSIKSQGVDYSKIVVHLVAAIQELSAKVAVLEGKQ
jgi:hypothetical protein